MLVLLQENVKVTRPDSAKVAGPAWGAEGTAAGLRGGAGDGARWRGGAVQDQAEHPIDAQLCAGADRQVRVEQRLDYLHPRHL